MKKLDKNIALLEGCKNCEYAPKTYEEYCISKKQPQTFCPDAYTEKAQYCGNYEKHKENVDANV